MKNQDLQKEKELLTNAKAEKKRFDELYRYFIDDVYRFSYSILNNKHDAEDISSQTMIQFYQKLDTFEWQGISLKSWLFTVARNLCYTKFRKPIESEYNDDLKVENEIEIGFVDEIMNKDLIERIRKEIQLLNPIEQELINLRIWEGMQFDEIAKIQNIKLSACKLRFYRAIEKLKTQVQDKNYMNAFSFPLLFTAIQQTSNLSVYHASGSLLTAGASIVLGKTAMSTGLISTIKTIIASVSASTSAAATAVTTSTVATTAVVASTAIVVTTGGYIAYKNYTYVQPRNPEVTQAPEIKKFEDKELGLYFEYPSDYKIEKQDENTVTLFANDFTKDSDGSVSDQESSLSFSKSDSTNCEEEIVSGNDKFYEYQLSDGRNVVRKMYGGPGSPLREYYSYTLNKNKLDSMNQPTYKIKCGLILPGDDNQQWGVLISKYPDFNDLDFEKVIVSAKAFSPKKVENPTPSVTPTKENIKTFSDTFLYKNTDIVSNAKVQKATISFIQPEGYSVTPLSASEKDQSYREFNISLPNNNASLDIRINYLLSGIGGMSEAKAGSKVLFMNDKVYVLDSSNSEDGPTTYNYIEINKSDCDADCIKTGILSKNVSGFTSDFSTNPDFKIGVFYYSGQENYVLELQEVLKTIKLELN